jgi:hypothetical protein
VVEEQAEEGEAPAAEPDTEQPLASEEAGDVETGEQAEGF